MDLSFFFKSPESLAAFFADLVYSSPFGMLLLFAFSLVANASLFLPIAVEPIVFFLAIIAPSLWLAIVLGLVTGTAAALGEMSGYILGMFGIKTLQKMSKTRVEKVFEVGEKLADKGVGLIFIFAFTPLPFDIIGIAAGLIKYDPKKFFAAAWAGKTARYLLVSLIGYFGGVALVMAVPWLKALLGI